MYIAHLLSSSSVRSALCALTYQRGFHPGAFLSGRQRVVFKDGYWATIIILKKAGVLLDCAIAIHQ